MAAIGGLAVGLIGNGVSAAGSAKQGRKLKAIGNFNAGIADQQAEDAIARGREAQDQLHNSVRKLIGAQRAGFAGQGVLLEGGDSSVANVQNDTNTLQDQDIHRIQVNAAREAWGFRSQAQNYRLGGSAQAQQSNANAAGTILGGLGDAFTSYSKISPYRTTSASTGY